MSYKTIYSTFLSGQLRSMGESDLAAFKLKMSEIKSSGLFPHHDVLKGTGSKTVLKKVGKTGDFTVQECAPGLGGKWRLFFYTTGYAPRNSLEAARRQNAFSSGATQNVPDGVMWCICLGHMEGSTLELYVASSKSTKPGPKTQTHTKEERDALVIDPQKYKNALKHETELTF